MKAAGLGTAGTLLGLTDLQAMASHSAAKGFRTIRMAAIGCANQGGHIIQQFVNTGRVEFVALCDVDPESEGCRATAARFPKARFFKDFRKMFDACADQFDAVCIAIPDHAHFPAAMLALHCGKHVYLEKPMTRTFYETELLVDAARRHPQLATQVGNQGHSSANYYQFKTWVEKGIIKDVYAIDANFNNARRWYDYDTGITRFPEAQPLPAGMDWDNWLSSAAWHDFNEVYHPGNWRSWFDFGMGVLGDWGAHIIDTCHEFLQLGLPYEIEPLKLTGSNDFFFPLQTTVRLRFGARGSLPPVDLTWYDGVGNLPPFPEGVPPTDRLGPGKFIYGRDLVFRGASHTSTLEIVPHEKALQMASSLPEVPECPSNHFDNFLNAIEGTEKARSSFEVFGPLNQVMALGVIAIRIGRPLRFDPTTKIFPGDAFANALLAGMPPRKGWEEFYRM